MYFFKLIFFSFFTLSFLETKGNSEITLDNVESKINNSFIESQIEKDASSLQAICLQLSDTISKNHGLEFFYWNGYANFLLAISGYYLHDNINIDVSLPAIKNSVNFLEKAHDEDAQNSDVTGLLSMSLSLCAKLNPKRLMMENSRLMAKAEAFSNMAMVESNTNVRSYLSKIMYEFYSVNITANKDILEQTCLKALYESKPVSQFHNLNPGWGLNLIYFFLISHYLDSGKTTHAKIWMDEALQKFPDDFFILKLNNKLNG